MKREALMHATRTMRGDRASAARTLWRMLASLACIAIGAASAHAQEMADQPLVEAALHHLMASEAGHELLATSRGVCVTLVHDGPRAPSPELLRRLAVDSIVVRGPQACHLDRQRRRLVTSSGEAAVQFSATSPTRLGADSAQIAVSWYTGPVTGAGYTCWLGREQVSWVVRSCRLDVEL